jgi:hypothetical protein
MSPDERLVKGTQELTRPSIVCKVSNASPSDNYPYMDTMCFININDNLVGNSIEAVDPNSEYSDEYEDHSGPIKMARDTGGDWYTPENY